MRRSFTLHLSVSICAAILFIGAFSLIIVPSRADKAEDAAKAAKAAVELAQKLAAAEKAAKEAAAKAAADAQKAAAKGGADAKKAADEDAKQTPQDKAADEAAKAADEAAKAADEAQDKAQDEQQEADDAANDAKNAGGSNKEKNEEADKQKEEADDAKAKADAAEREASDKEKEADEADKKADEADKKIKNRKVKDKKAEARRLRKRARAARRAAAKKIREAEKLLDDKKKVEGKNPTEGTKDLEKSLEELKKGLYSPKEEPPKQGRVVNVPNLDTIESAAQTTQPITANGLQTVKFDTINGRVIVHLPDDMAAGDTISGTVIEEPKGSTPAEKKKNLDALQGLVIEIGGTVIPPKQPQFTIQPLFEMAPNEVAAGQSQTLLITIRNGNQGYNTVPNQLLGRAVIPSNPTMTSPPTPSVPQAIPSLQIPTLGQQGRLVQITGPFDGNSSNTTLAFGPERSTVQDFEKNTENVSGGFGLIRPLVESRNKMVFESPDNFTGPVQLMLKEGNAQTLAPYRNLAVRLSAPKTNLLRAERTTLTVEVRGLKGIQKDVPLELDSKGVVTMDGGNSQKLRISPAEVNRDGIYTTTRAITGQQAGAFTVSATVVVKSKDELLEELEVLRRNKKYDCEHGKEHQQAMADRIAVIKRVLREFHGEKVLNDPIDGDCPPKE